MRSDSISSIYIHGNFGRFNLPEDALGIIERQENRGYVKYCNTLKEVYDAFFDPDVRAACKRAEAKRIEQSRMEEEPLKRVPPGPEESQRQEEEQMDMNQIKVDSQVMRRTENSPE